MQVPTDKPRVVCFGVFEVNLQEAELRKSGVRIKLQEQPFQILAMLLERPGQTVTREELQRQFWPTNTLVDVEHSLNSSIRKLREALGDDSENPRFIETLHRRGYRFIAPVDGHIPAFDRLGNFSLAAPPAAQSGTSAVTAGVSRHRRLIAVGVFASVAVGIASFGIYSLVRHSAAAPFQKFTITQITNSGKAARAAISPDGRYVLSALDDSGMESLWLRNVATGTDTQVIPPSASQYESLAFSPDGNYIYFRKAGSEEQCCDLYRAPILGGAPQVLVRNIYSDIAFSADGQRIAYLRVNAPGADRFSIVTASLEGDNEVVLHGEPLSSEQLLPYVAWSTTSNEISFPVYSIGREEGSVGAVETVSVSRREFHRFAAFKRKFPEEIRWSPDGQTLLAVYRQTGANWSRAQIGFFRRGAADIEPITRDTNRYKTLTLSADGRTLTAVLARSYSSVYVLSRRGRGFGEPRPVLSQSNEFDEWSWLNWSADGGLLVSNTGRLFKLALDGKNQGELLSDPGALIVKPSPCGKDYLVLTWTFHGGTSAPGIWRTNADGSGPARLTDGRYDFYPVCSPDEKWVYYVDNSHIFRVPLNGSGRREPILPQVEAIGGLSVSPDGKMLAAAVAGETAEQAASIAVFDLTSSKPPRVLPAYDYADDVYGNGILRLAPDGKSVAYVRRARGVDNIWLQPLNGSAGYPITDFKSERIWSFSLSPDGKNLAVLRGHFDSDVVLLQESIR